MPDLVCERDLCLQYSLQTDKACVHWAKVFVLWAARSQEEAKPA